MYKNFWNEQSEQQFINPLGKSEYGVDLGSRVYTSRLIGSVPDLVMHGGGNTSCKTKIKNIFNEYIDVICVKGSGWDLETIEAEGLPAIKLSPLLELRKLKNLSDEDMVNQQRSNLLKSTSPNPSVETLLHAFLPHKFVDHTHATPFLVLANLPDYKKIVQEIFEDPAQQKLTIVGAGEMAMSVIQNFYENGIKNIHAVNRSKKFLQINESLSLVTNNLSRLGSLIQSTDILVTSVNSPLPIIGKGLIENAMKERKNKPMLLIDLGVPRNIEDQVRDLEYAYLFTIEDIEHVTQENLEERSIEAKRAKILIQERVKALSQDKIKKENRNEAYEVLKNICEVMSEKDLLALMSSDHPYKYLKKNRCSFS